MPFISTKHYYGDAYVSFKVMIFFRIADTQDANISAQLAELRGELSERNMQQNSDIMDLMEMLRNLTQKQGNLLSPQLDLPLVCINVT